MTEHECAIRIHTQPARQKGNDMKITLKMVRDDWGACYDADRLAKLYDRPMTALEVLTRTDGPWADVPQIDRLWTVLHKDVLTDKTFRLFAVWCAREALSRVEKPDPRSVNACDVAERHAHGQATNEELAAAKDDAWAARNAMDARDARDAAMAAWSAATSAGWSAATGAGRDASMGSARDVQVNKLVEIIQAERE